MFEPSSGTRPGKHRAAIDFFLAETNAAAMRNYHRSVVEWVGDVRQSPGTDAAKHSELTGTIIKYNKRTLTVITEGGQHWNVSPGFLKKLAAAQQGDSDNEVVQIFDHEK